MVRSWDRKDVDRRFLVDVVLAAVPRKIQTPTSEDDTFTFMRDAHPGAHLLQDQEQRVQVPSTVAHGQLGPRPEEMPI